MAPALIEGDRSVEEILELPQDKQNKFIQQVGGVSPVTPGESGEATVDLQPGRYGIACFLPAPDGEPHVSKGMFAEFTVA